MEEQDGLKNNTQGVLTQMFEGYELGGRWTYDPSLTPVVNKLCDCMLQSTRHSCKVFQVVYIIILLTLVTVLLCYRHYKLKMIEAKHLSNNNGTENTPSVSEGNRSLLPSPSPNNQRRCSQNRRIESSQSKRKILIAVMFWVCSRIVYFSTAYLDKKYTSAFVCQLEILQNLPVFLMYFCFLVVQRVILNTYVVILN